MVTVWRLKQCQVKVSSFVSRGGCKGLQWCGFAWFSVQFCGNFFLSCGIAFYKTKGTAVFRNFRVISIRFVASLCYSVRCLYMYVFLCSFTNRKSKKFDKNHLNDRPKRFGFFQTLMFPLSSCLANRSLHWRVQFCSLKVFFFIFDHVWLPILIKLNSHLIKIDWIIIKPYIRLNSNLYFFIAVAQLHFKSPLANLATAKFQPCFNSNFDNSTQLKRCLSWNLPQSPNVKWSFEAEFVPLLLFCDETKMVTPFFICVFTCYGYTKNIYSKEEKIWKVEVYFF